MHLPVVMISVGDNTEYAGQLCCKDDISFDARLFISYTTLRALLHACRVMLQRGLRNNIEFMFVPCDAVQPWRACACCSAHATLCCRTCLQVRHTCSRV